MKPDTSRLASRVPTRNWLLDGASLISTDGHNLVLDTHGIDRYLASTIAGRGIVIYGEFPSLVEITGDTARVDEALLRVSSAGQLFTVYASVYRDGATTALLLDHLR